MPSWDDGESSDDSLLSEFADGHDLSPRPPIPATILEPNFTGYDDSDYRCKHDMPMYIYVCYEGENTGRKFLGCGCKYEHERDSRIHGNVEYATKNYQLVLAKRDLEKRNLELHKELGNPLEYVAEVTTDDLELETAKRQKAEQEVASMKEERKKMECSIATLLEEKKKLECHVARLNEENKKLEGSVATVKDEKRKVEYYVADLLKLAHDHRAKIKKIAELCEE
ncbi:hypothetical protein ACQ4PT_017684 [Festuca glaucescens]